MRTLRVLVVGALIAGGLVVLAPGATASVSAASKTCKSLTALYQKIENNALYAQWIANTETAEA